jgi:hypothetical protein
MPHIDFKIETDSDKCGKLWNMFSSNRDFWDLWEVRECFLTGNSQLHFIVGYQNGEIIGILPLCLNKERDYYTWIGNEFPEHNKIFIKNKDDIKYFIEQAPEKLCLEDINQAEKDFFTFQEYSNCYYLNLETFNNIEDYLATFKGKHRNNIRHDINQVMEAGYQVHINDHYNDNFLDVIEKFNIKRFGDESSFKEKGYKESINNLIQLAQKKEILNVIYITKNDVPVGIDFSIFYKDIYMPLIGSSDPEISNVGKVLNYKHIEHAFNLKAKKIDFMAGGDGWKKLLKCSGEMMYQFKRGIN